ncbi:type II toxin-antitoxin system MqsA family antitoxin [Acetobacterium bakii]|uniref:YgiT-type zinc finger domain-containing protein n=1 Tax=Acetobacterium bakii TaxID=52689 RepID=A0A0L6TYF1_9FIRM|nr:type II toxin-antitoxin system MqsA family antitoxin [Acetobacterium bakii]KNZ41286.1 YgiT-type zinc finger domain-containing protein [Acetobacterium bakii]
MNCFFCQDDMVDGTTTYMADLENCVVIIKNVPCHRCSQCGVESFSADIAQKIEEIFDKLKNKLTKIAVVNFSNQAA